MPSLEAINLTKKYGNLTALSDLNLKINGAKCVGFLGPMEQERQPPLRYSPI